MVGDDALVAALVGEGDMAQVQDSGVLHHPSSCRGSVGCCALVVSADVGVVLRLCVAEQLLVLTPREGHGGGAAARGRTGEMHVAAEDRHRSFWLHGDLGLWKVVWRWTATEVDGRRQTRKTKCQTSQTSQ